METWFIHNGVLEYDNDTHTYWFNGEKCISVTQLIKHKFPKKYDGIDPEVLRKAAERGTWIHSTIELYETMGLTTEEEREFRDYLFLKNYYHFKVLASEIPIVIEYNGLYVAGRLDQVLEDKDKGICLCDIKTTSTLDLEYLAWQLSLYKLGYEQSYNDYKINNLKAIHLKNGKRKYADVVEIPLEELNKFLEEYKGEKENGI